MFKADGRLRRGIARSVLAALILTMPGFDAYRAAAATIELSNLKAVAPQAAPTAQSPGALAPLSALAAPQIPQATLANPEIPAAQEAAQPSAPLAAAAAIAAMPSLAQPDASPAALSAEAASLFDKTLKFSGADGSGASPEIAGDAFLGAVRSVRRPGRMIDDAELAEAGKGAGLAAQDTAKAVARLKAEGKLVSFSGGRHLVVDLPAADPEDAPVVEGRALAMKAVALLNQGSTEDKMRAVALLRRAYMKYPQGEEDPAAVESRRQIIYLRMNAALEIVRDALKENEAANAGAGTTHKALIAEARAYFNAAYYDSAHVPARPSQTATDVAADAVNNYKLAADRAKPDYKELEYGWQAAKLAARQPAPEQQVAPDQVAPQTPAASKSTAMVLVKSNADQPARVPVIALNGVFFPGTNRSVRLGLEGKDAMIALTKAMNGGGYLIAASYAEGAGTKERHHPTATLVRLSNFDMAGGKMIGSFTAVREAEIAGYDKDKEGTLFARVSYAARPAGDADRLAGLARAGKAILSEFGEAHEDIKPFAVNRILSENRPEVLANVLAEDMPFSMKVKQALLSAKTLEERLEAGVMELMTLVRGAYKSKNDNAGNGGPSAETKPLETMEDLEARMEAIGMPEEVRAVTKKEFGRLLEMNPKDSEAQKVRAYVDWLVEVPWAKRTEDHYDMGEARKILDRDHSGMEQVKERVLEFLAVRKKTGSKKGAIVCFSGPPGVGKTSIAAGIAEALGRKFVRLSLGGVHDETELRGHGRTYLGSLPGSVIKQMKVAGTVNPVMLLDEVDKIGRDGNHGDPTAALLEILDPAQNNTFRDHYMEVPYDLSQVLFIVTANELGNIPAPLRDRMEIIEFNGYTPQEKIAIVQQHVMAEKSRVNGLEPGQVNLTEGAIRKVIEGYTREAGVRGLREKIDSLLRKISAWSETRSEAIPATVDEKDVPKYLGIPRFSLRETAENSVGLATGLAVNDFGGSTLNVEVLAVPGNGQLKIRKQMMKMTDDSSLNVYALIKSKAAELGIPQDAFAKNDIEIAFTPAGDIDGPSAGVTMATAMASRLTGRPVKEGVAMTGEITMTGRVLPIGGLKQKVMAAHRMGYKLVLFPQANLKDVEDIPQEVRDGIELVAVSSIDEVFARALEPGAAAPTAAAPAKSGFVWYKPWTWFSPKAK